MKRYCFIILVLAAGSKTQAQGCSDAGFCSLKYAGTSAHKNSIALGNISGVADGHTFVNSTYITYSMQLHKKLLWDTKLVANYASGKLGHNFNAGDVFTNISYKAWQNSTQQKSITALAGLKIPLTKSNDKAGGQPLPMAYQASLGTYDLLLGGNVQINKWEFTNAWQIPLTRQNENTFIKENSSSGDFSSTNKFRRKSDVLLRAAYNIKRAGSKFSFKPNLLAVYHLSNDSYEDGNTNRQQLTGSKGLTLNANIIGKYFINRSNSIELSIAAPFVVRQIRPDGLTREFTAGIEYKISF
ncbi:hypothetical protein [Ferruginibacter sp.]